MSSQVKRLIVSALRSIEEENEKSGNKPGRPKSREGKKVIAGHFEPAMAWQLKKLALDQETTVQALLEEAVLDLFEKNHLLAR